MAKSEIKLKLEKVITECYKKAEEKKFRDLNFVFPKNKTPKQFFKTKIDTLHNIDEYSATFLSIHTRAKVALREFQQLKFDGAYLELLRLVLNLSDKLNKANLKAIRVYDKNELPEMVVGEDITASKEVVEAAPLLPIMKNTKLIKQGVTGKKLVKNRVSLNGLIDTLQDVEL